MEMLRIITGGSVDDGKSTLIGRLLYDTRSLLADQLSSLENASQRRGAGLDFSLVTDGLKEEMEQGITIDVAYRYFTSGHVKYILADTPGHFHYTRNFVTACSTAQVALIMVDARNGVVQQTRRHLFLASLFGVEHLCFCINKMDLVEYDRVVFESIKATLEQLLSSMKPVEAQFIPMSALLGENIVGGSSNMPWYEGQSLMETLDRLNVRDLGNGATRFSVQATLQDDKGNRWYMGQVQGGSLSLGDEFLAMPQGSRTRVAKIQGPDGPLKRPGKGMSVALMLEPAVVVNRGSLLVTEHFPCELSTGLVATLCWLDPRPLEKAKSCWLRLGTFELKCSIVEIEQVFDMDSFSRQAAATLHSNGIARVAISLEGVLAWDRYSDNRHTGSFILIDGESNQTIAAGIIESAFEK